METNTLSSAIKKIAVSYIFIYFSINIWVIDILPDWLGYFMIVSVLPVISQEERSAQLLRPFGIALGVWTIIEWILKMIGAELNLMLVNLVVGIIVIYFHFQLITNIASLDIEESKRKRLLILRTLIVILHTIMTLSLLTPPNLIDNEVYTYILMGIAIPQTIFCIWIACELFGLSKSLLQAENEGYELTDSTETANEIEPNEQVNEKDNI